MKNLKKLCNISLIFVLLLISFVSYPQTAEGKTLGDLKEELNKKIEEYNQNETEKELTNEEIEKVQNKIQDIHSTIEENQKEIIRLEEEIIELNKEIVQKEQEIKDVVKFYHISNGTSTYLEYIFGASSFTDLIYRFAVSEQLLDYNDKLVHQYNEMLKEAESKQKALEEQEIKLKAEQKNLEVELKKLGNKLSSFTEVLIDIEEEIKSQKEAIRIYEEEYKCKDTDEISDCTTNKLPADTAFWRPMKSGWRTSEFGYRTYTLNGKKVTDFHSGIDLTTYPKDNVPIYAAAAGVVISIAERTSCGGNKIYIHHKINGKTYTTAYVHLRTILVKVGDVVTKDTQIAVMGGDPKKEYWDKCSTGAHLHFAISTGLYLKDYSSWNSYLAHSVNPRTMVNFPPAKNSFSDRTTKY